MRLWKSVPEDMMFFLLTEEGHSPTEKLHLQMYKLYIWRHYGKLGHGNCIPLPICVKSEIKKKFLDPQNEYVGVKETLLLL